MTTWSQLEEHRLYWSDRVKIDRYRAALAQVITPSSVVLDLGAGTGLLGLLACQAGAARVYGVDDGSIIGLATQILAANGYADRYVPIRSLSTDVQLPELVDVVVGDQIGGFAFDAGVLEYYEDARTRLLKPGGAYVPGSFDLRVGLVDDDESHDAVAFWSGKVDGLDVSAGGQLASNSVAPRTLRAEQFLGPTVDVCHLDAANAEPFSFEATLAVERAGRLNGVVGMFCAHMAPGVLMTNDPTEADPMEHRWQNVHPLDRACHVEAGDRVHVTFRIRPKPGHIDWTITVLRGPTTMVTERHSTFLGTLLSPEDLAQRAARTVVPRPSAL